jgi:hypothetical protein
LEAKLPVCKWQSQVNLTFRHTLWQEVIEEGMGNGEWGMGEWGNGGTGMALTTKNQKLRNNNQPITNYQLPITNYQLPIPNYQLPITHSPFPIITNYP